MIFIPIPYGSHRHNDPNPNLTNKRHLVHDNTIRFQSRQVRFDQQDHQDTSRSEAYAWSISYGVEPMTKILHPAVHYKLSKTAVGKAYYVILCHSCDVNLREWSLRSVRVIADAPNRVTVPSILRRPRSKITGSLLFRRGRSLETKQRDPFQAVIS